MGISRSTSRARWAWRMSRPISPPLARLTSASGSPLAKWTTLSRSRLLYGSPQRRTGMCTMGSCLRAVERFANEYLNRIVPYRPAPCKRVLSVHPDRRRRRELADRPHAADAVPRELLVGRFALALVALGEARHEELLGQGRQQDAAGLAVVHHLVVVVEVHHLGGRPRLWGVVADLVAVLRADRLGAGQAHERVAVG